MRLPRLLLLACGLLAAVASTTAAGCGADCHATLTCGEAPVGGGGSGSASGGGGAGGDNGPCVPSETQGPVDSGCGVFVRLGGDDTNSGSKESPVATLEKALSLAAPSGKPAKPVYACAEVFQEAVVVPAGAVLFGGLDCSAGWAYVGASKRTTIAPSAGAIPLKLIKGGSGSTRLVDIIAEAADAPAGGASSIAAIVDDVTASFEHCDFIAGDASDGEKGKTPTDSVGPSMSSDAQIAGNTGANACKGGGSGNPGAPEKINSLCQSSIGGAGGAGMQDAGVKGSDGAPPPVPNPKTFGAGGAGSAGSGCGKGKTGNVGLKGIPGAGAALEDIGVIDLSGYTGASGKPGAPGAPGQGGGGGGGQIGKVNCFGASGGSGGAGGCGGGGGLGGQAGGASIALISLSASISFKNVSLTVGRGGKGGEGGMGQPGGAGGIGGSPGQPDGQSGLFAACFGGDGSSGGFGGRGGGGRGGPSIGIAFTGSPPSTGGAAIKTGIAGTGGEGGEGPEGSGANGEAASTIAFK